MHISHITHDQEHFTFHMVYILYKNTILSYDLLFSLGMIIDRRTIAIAEDIFLRGLMF